MTDRNLNVRAGINVGIEPTLLGFVQASSGNVLPLNPSGDTVIAQSTKQAARVLFAAGSGISGYLFNNGPDDVDVDFLFVDALGNEISLTGGLPVVLNQSAVPVPFLQTVETFRFFCLAPGEKIVARATPDPGDPLSIMGQAGLLGWWRATDVVQADGTCSEMFDLSGNGRHLIQATIARQPAFLATGGPRSQPCVVFDGTVQVLGQQKTLRYAGAAFAAIGTFPSLWAIADCHTATCVNIAPVMQTTDDPTTTTGLLIDRRNTVAPQHFGAQGPVVGAAGGFDFAEPLDNDVPHLLGLVPSSTSAFVNTYRDGSAGTPKAASGTGLSTTLGAVAMGASTNADTLNPTLCWGGRVMDAWLTAAEPTPAQLARLLRYSQLRYNTP